jgi:hypothetical protein
VEALRPLQLGISPVRGRAFLSQKKRTSSTGMAAEGAQRPRRPAKLHKPGLMSQPLLRLVAMNEKRLRQVIKTLKASPADEPVVLVPIDKDGRECGPPEVYYAPPEGVALN